MVDKQEVAEPECSAKEIKGVERRCLFLIQLCSFALGKEDEKSFPSRNYLRELYKESTGMEEYIDRCGAQKNELWYPFREAVAALKMFSHLYYDLLHIQEATYYYSLLTIEGDFAKETQLTLEKLRTAIFASTRTMLERMEECGLFREGFLVEEKSYSEEDRPFKFPANRETRHVEKPGGTVVYLATKFLNLAEDEDVREVLQTNRENYEDLIPDQVNEEILRIVAARFHNLQAHYDTRIFESDVESQDRRLKVLRSHISVTYHLLEIATDLAHYYERHIGGSCRKARKNLTPPLAAAELLKMLFDFVLLYAARYLGASKELCRNMIRSYAVEGQIEVPIPNYRGFHVRPSRLIAGIVDHYGSEVRMFLDGQDYDAGFSLDLFRANEAINAQKRRYIASVIEKAPLPDPPLGTDPMNFRKGLQLLFRTLKDQNKIILYDMNIPFDELTPLEDESLEELACRFIKHYMSVSKLDVNSDLKVVFQGDARVLMDLELLATNGYGEDKFGNNTVLPKALKYLRGKNAGL